MPSSFRGCLQPARRHNPGAPPIGRLPDRESPASPGVSVDESAPWALSVALTMMLGSIRAIGAMPPSIPRRCPGRVGPTTPGSDALAPTACAGENAVLGCRRQSARGCGRAPLRLRTRPVSPAPDAPARRRQAACSGSAPPGDWGGTRRVEPSGECRLQKCPRPDFRRQSLPIRRSCGGTCPSSVGATARNWSATLRCAAIRCRRRPRRCRPGSGPSRAR